MRGIREHRVPPSLPSHKRAQHVEIQIGNQAMLQNNYLLPKTNANVTNFHNFNGLVGGIRQRGLVIISSQNIILLKARKRHAVRGGSRIYQPVGILLFYTYKPHLVLSWRRSRGPEDPCRNQLPFSQSHQALTLRLLLIHAPFSHCSHSLVFLAFVLSFSFALSFAVLAFAFPLWVRLLTPCLAMIALIFPLSRIALRMTFLVIGNFLATVLLVVACLPAVPANNLGLVFGCVVFAAPFVTLQTANATTRKLHHPELLFVKPKTGRHLAPTACLAMQYQVLSRLH